MDRVADGKLIGIGHAAGVTNSFGCAGKFFVASSGAAPRHFHADPLEVPRPIVPLHRATQSCCLVLRWSPSGGLLMHSSTLATRVSGFIRKGKTLEVSASIDNVLRLSSAGLQHRFSTAAGDALRLPQVPAGPPPATILQNEYLNSVFWKVCLDILASVNVTRCTVLAQSSQSTQTLLNSSPFLPDSWTASRYAFVLLNFFSECKRSAFGMPQSVLCSRLSTWESNLSAKTSLLVCVARYSRSLTWRSPSSQTFCVVLEASGRVRSD